MKLVAAVALLLIACDHVDRPMRPLPEQLYGARTLDGRRIDAAFLHGRPWVINLWVPG